MFGEGWQKGLQTASPFLLGLGSDLQGHTSGAASMGAALMQRQMENEKKKAAIAGMIDQFGLSPAEAQLLGTMDAGAQQSHLLGIMRENRARARSGGPTKAEILKAENDRYMAENFGGGHFGSAAPAPVAAPQAAPALSFPGSGVVAPGTSLPAPTPAPAAPGPMSGDVLGLDSPLAQRFEGPAAPHNATAGLVVGPAGLDTPIPEPIPEPAPVQVAQASTRNIPVQPGEFALTQPAAAPEPAPTMSEQGMANAARYPKQYYDNAIVQALSVGNQQLANRIKGIRDIVHAEPEKRGMTQLADGYYYWTDSLEAGSPERVNPDVSAAPADEYGRYRQEVIAQGQQPLSRIDYARAKQKSSVIEVDENGNVTVAEGPAATALGRAGQNALDLKAIESADTLARLERIEDNYANNPELLDAQTMTGQLKRMGLEWADYLSPESLSDDQKVFLADVTQARGDMMENLNFTIKAITGAAMTEPEAKRIGGTLPLPTDSPTVWKAKMDRAIESTRMAVARYNYWRNNRLEGRPEDVETISGMKRVMKDRVKEILEEERANTDDEVAAQARTQERMQQEFGI